MELRNVKREYTNAYNQIKKLNLEVSTITDYQIFYIDFNFYVEMSKRDDKESIKDWQNIHDNPEEYFPSSNLSIAIKGDNDQILCAHFISLKGYDEKFAYFVGDLNEKINRSAKDKKRFCDNLLLTMLFALNEKKTLVGTEQVNMRKKSGQSEIVPITHISNKKYSATQKNTKGEPIDWKHSWEVIGHWRICSNIGKDRNGEYNQVNRTWVIPSIRGKGELVKKLRIIA